MRAETRVEILTDDIVNDKAQEADAVTRVEIILSDILAGRVTSQVPRTRVEIYLAKISGVDIELPQPETNPEKYLAKIAGMDVELPDPSELDGATRWEQLLAEWAAEPVGFLKTVSGSIVSVSDALARPADSLSVTLSPVQASGTPSPDNPIPISGHSEIKAWREETYDATADPYCEVTLGQEVYGGSLDVTTGVLTIDKVMWTKNTASMNNDENYAGWQHAGLRDYLGTGLNGVFLTQMNVFDRFGYNSNGPNDIVYFYKGWTGLTQSEWQEMALDMQIIVPLATPLTYQLTPQEVSMLTGDNVVWSDAGDVELKYYGTEE